MHEVRDEIIAASGTILKVFGAVMLIPIAAAVAYAEYITIFPFLVSAFASIAVGVVINLRFPMKDALSIESTIIVAPMAWVLVAAVGAVPYTFIAGAWPLDAFFESMSGFSTTGMTILTGLETLPKALLLWRSMTEWIGGIGVILLFAIFLRGGMSTWRLYSLEGKDDKFTPSIRSTVKSIWVTYSALTGLCALLLALAGMPVYDAINHALTTVSTGGFSTRTESIAAFDSRWVELIISAFMILGAINFALYYHLFKLNLRRVLADVETKALVVIIIFAGMLVALMLGLSGATVAPTLTNSYFNVISAITTTGFTSADLLMWPLAAQVLLLILMLLGGSSGSTASGMKLWRAIVLYKVGAREVERISLPPSAVRPIKIGNKILDEDYVMKVGAFFFIYIISIFIQFMILAINIQDPMGALSLVISAQANFGPAFYPMASLDGVSKAVLIFGMWFGRLELFVVLALFSRGIPSFIREAYSERKKAENGSRVEGVESVGGVVVTNEP